MDSHPYDTVCHDTTRHNKLIIKYDTHDYNVIFNDVVLTKWKKIHVFIF
jgi:hypothetical protein